MNWTNLTCKCRQDCERIALAKRALTTAGDRHGVDRPFFESQARRYRRLARILRKHGHYLILPPGQLQLL